MSSAEKFSRYLAIVYYALAYWPRRFFGKKDKLSIGFLVEEFFHEKFRGFGGYGMTLKYVTDYFNNDPKSKVKADVILMTPLEIDGPQAESAHNADVITMSRNMRDKGGDFQRYCRMIHKQKLDVFIGVDHFRSYEYPLMAFPSIPWVIWMKDPRDIKKWHKIASIELVRKQWGLKSMEEAKIWAQESLDSFRRIYKRGKMFGRKVVIATEASDFISIGRSQYGLKELKPAFLSKPIPLPLMDAPSYSEKPSFMFLARLDPIKRPWIFCELAKRFPQAEFLVVGQSNASEIMDNILARYKDVPNLKFLGRVFGKDKDSLFRRIWAVVNTSVHEGLPVSMVEGYSYGKTAVASENPDGITARFGFAVKEVLGDAFDQKTVDLFAEPVEKIIKGQFDREGLFRKGREYIRDVHSFEKFEATVREIVLTSKYDHGFVVDEDYKV